LATILAIDWRIRSCGAGPVRVYPDGSFVAIVLVRSVAGQMTKALAVELLAFRALWGTGI
jgi:hypothetical protein